MLFVPDKIQIIKGNYPTLFIHLSIKFLREEIFCILKHKIIFAKPPALPHTGCKL